MLRYIFYREHKYVLYAVTELERLIAKTDFTSNEEVSKVSVELLAIREMLHFHAAHEDKFHQLLRDKNSEVHLDIERDHLNHDAIFEVLTQKLSNIQSAVDSADRILRGRDFYLAYRDFEMENLRHINQEELVVMPELQRLYADAELMKIEADSYERMTVEQMVHMITVLFPQMNTEDHQAFFSDIQRTQPQKYLSLKAKLLSTLGWE